MPTPAYSRSALVPNGIYAADARKLLQAARDYAADEQSWTATALDLGLRNIAREKNVAALDLFRILRVALTWPLAAPGLFETLVALGKESSVARLDAALLYLGDVSAG